MSTIYLINKPYQVLSQFTDKEGRQTLADFIEIPRIYPAGRLDYDSEGLLILTGDGNIQARIADPKFKLEKSYWVQVEGSIDQNALKKLQEGVMLKDGLTKPAKAKIIPEPKIWDRVPPIRERKNQTTSWIELSIKEGKNRQVRRMTAEVGFPTLRLIRHRIGHWNLADLEPGSFREETLHLPSNKKEAQNKKHKYTSARRNEKKPRQKR